MATLQEEHLKIEQLQKTAMDDIEVAAGRDRENLEGWIPSLASDSEVRDALEKAFDYRGDITITRKDGSKVEGYLYDRNNGSTLETSVVRIMPVPPKGSTEMQRVNIPYSDIAALNFSGQDKASGRTFEAWVKKYWEKKQAGETNIQIEPEKLD